MRRRATPPSLLQAVSGTRLVAILASSDCEVGAQAPEQLVTPELHPARSARCNFGSSPPLTRVGSVD